MSMCKEWNDINNSWDHPEHNTWGWGDGIESFEKFSWPEEIFYHSGLNEIPPIKTGVRYSQEVKLWDMWGFFNCCYFSRHSTDPVGRGCKIHRLHLRKRVRPHTKRVSWIWHETIWWWGSSNAGALGNAEYFFIGIAPWSTQTPEW